MSGSPSTIDRETFIEDVRFTKVFNTFGAWCGIAFVVLLFGGWGLIGGFIPLIGASTPPEAIAEQLSANPTLSKLGLSLAMVGIFVTIPFFMAISLQIRRSEPRVPLMAVLQLASGLVITVILAIPMLFFIVLAFRPDRSPELSLMLNDMSYLTLILPWPPIVLQVLAVTVTALRSRPLVPVFPRWIGYFNLWVAFLVIPANMILFFKDGVFAWTGLVGFWIPAAVFGAWYPIMTWAVLRAGRAQYEADLLRASDFPQAGTADSSALKR